MRILFCLLTCCLLLLSCSAPEVTHEPTATTEPLSVPAPISPGPTETPREEIAAAEPEPLPAPPETEPPSLEDVTTIPPGDEFEFTLETEDAGSDNLVFWATNLPPGATFDPETRTFSWTPDYGQAGVYCNVCFYVANEYGMDYECIKIFVRSVNMAPTVSTVPLKVAKIGELMAFTLQATDPDGDELEFSARNLPAGAQFSPPTFTWVPTEVGIWPAIIFTVSDGKLKDSIQVTIAVIEGENN